MATKNIVPRASGEGGLGTSSKLWKEAHHVTASFGDVSLTEDDSNRLQVSGGPLVAASGLSGSLTQLSDGSSYLVEGSNISITTGSSGQITIASPLAGVVEDLNTLGAPSTDGEFIVATGAGAFAYESGATVRTSLGLGTGDSPTFTDLTLSGDLTVNGTTTTVNTDNLLVEDPVVLLGTGAASANTNGGLALLSGSSVSGESLVIGRVANDTWGVGRKDVQGGAVTTLADMTLVDFQAAGITASGLTLGATAVTSTAAELNLLDTSAISAASGSSLRYDGSTLQWEEFSGGGVGSSAADDITIGDAAVSIGTTSGDTTINSANGQTTTISGSNVVLSSENRIVVGHDLVPSIVGTYDLGATDREWVQLYLCDGGAVRFGHGQDVALIHEHNEGIKLQMYTQGSEGEPIFKVVTSLTDLSYGPQVHLIMEDNPDVGDTIGSFNFRSEVDGDTSTTHNYSLIKSTIFNKDSTSSITSDIKFDVASSGSLYSALIISGSTDRQTGSVDIPGHNATDSGLMLGGTLVTSTATELNKLDGATITTAELNLLDASAISAASGSSLRYDGSSLQWEAFSGGGGGGLSNVVEDTTPQLGGTLDLNSQAIQGNLIPSAADTYSLGSSAAEWADAYLADGGVVYFGNDQDVYLRHVADSGLDIFMNAPTSGEPKLTLDANNASSNGASLVFETKAADAGDPGDILGNIDFRGYNSLTAIQQYASIKGIMTDLGSAGETGKIDIQVYASASNTSALTIEGTSTAGIATVDLPDHNGSTGGLKLGGTLVTATASELNLLDGGTSVGSSITLQNTDGFVVNDGGTMKLIPASDISTFVGGGGGAGGGKHGLTETKSASFTTTAFASAEERQLYIVDSASAVTATLADPGATTYDGYEINIKRLGSGTVHITGSAGVLGIDGSATFDLPSQYSSVTLVATGSQYVII